MSSLHLDKIRTTGSRLTWPSRSANFKNVTVLEIRFLLQNSSWQCESHDSDESCPFLGKYNWNAGELWSNSHVGMFQTWQNKQQLKKTIFQDGQDFFTVNWDFQDEKKRIHNASSGLETTKVLSPFFWLRKFIRFLFEQLRTAKNSPKGAVAPLCCPWKYRLRFIG